MLKNINAHNDDTSRFLLVEEAEQYIAGYSILNDWSARDVQRREMKVGLGPAKGKDFATGLGPYMVTPDELDHLRKNKSYDMAMKAFKNDIDLGSTILVRIVG